MSEAATTTPCDRRDRERGQAMVEFALILFPLLIIVSGIIWFGIGLNYWLDMQRIANQGARWAAVNNWPPDCPPPSENDPGACTGTRSLQQTMLRQVLTSGLHSTVSITVCYPGKNAAQVTRGDPVRVELRAPFTLFWLDRLAITLRASSTMRLEQKPTRISGADRCLGT